MGAMTVIAGLLIWQVISRSLVAYLATTSPHAALSIRSTDPTALLALAQSGLAAVILRQSEAPPSSQLPDERPQPPGNRLPGWADVAGKALERDTHADQTPDQVRRWAELALANDPFSARALRILGQLADRAGDEERASKFMQAAATRSLRESTAHYWLMQKSFAGGDYATAMRAADVLLRTRSQVMNNVVPTLAQAAENEVASGELKRVLAEAPPWRGAFFSTLPKAVSDARTPLGLLLSLRDTKVPPTTADLRAYLNVLIQHKFYELAYYAWLQFLPHEQLSSLGFLSNGSFEATPSGLPFDWAITSGAGVTVDIAERPDQQGEHALLLEFGQGRVDFRGVSQLIMLPAGTYQFMGKYKGEIVGRRGLKWRAACAASNAPPLGESTMLLGAWPTWKDLEFSFTVPAADCRAQHIRLELDARSASEQLVTGAIWHDELAIVRLN